MSYNKAKTLIITLVSLVIFGVINIYYNDDLLYSFTVFLVVLILFYKRSPKFFKAILNKLSFKISIPFLLLIGTYIIFLGYIGTTKEINAYGIVGDMQNSLNYHYFATGILIIFHKIYFFITFILILVTPAFCLVYVMDYSLSFNIYGDKAITKLVLVKCVNIFIVIPILFMLIYFVSVSLANKYALQPSSDFMDAFKNKSNYIYTKDDSYRYLVVPSQGKTYFLPNGIYIPQKEDGSYIIPRKTYNFGQFSKEFKISICEKLYSKENKKINCTNSYNTIFK